MLEPPDSFHLNAAIGWLELGNTTAATEELEKIKPLLRTTTDVLVVRYALYSQNEKWLEAQIVSEALVKAAPYMADYWCWLAYAQRRSPQGNIELAQTTMAQAAIIFPEEPTIAYNLACYASKLGQLPEAKEWLDKALNSPLKHEFQKMILEDSDLESLRQQYGL